jgi:hypothetical protein
MTSWTDLEASGSGEVVYILEIVGVGVFTTYDYTPTDSWFTDAGYGASRVYPYLKYEDLGPIDESIDFLEGSIKVESIRARIADVAGAVTALFKDWHSQIFTWLNSNVASATTTTFAAVDTSLFPSSTATNSQIFIGQEACTYGGRTATSFTGLTRGILGTRARTYAVTTDSETGVEDQPVITAAPHTLVGRRAYLHAAAMVDGSPGSTSVIYRGTVGKSIRAGEGEWSIPIDHVSEILDRKVGQFMPQSEIQSGYYMCGLTDIASASGTAIAINDDSGGRISDDYVVIDAGFYNITDLEFQWEAEMINAAINITPHLVFDGEKFLLKAAAVANRFFELLVQDYDPLWCLGFESGIYQSDVGAAYEREAQEEPKLFVMQWGAYRSGLHRPTFEVADASQFIVSGHVQVPGNPWAIVQAASGTTITLVSDSLDPVRSITRTSYGASVKNAWVVIDEEDDMLLKHVFVLNGDLIKNTLKKMLFLEPGQVELEQWCASGSEATDFDFDELDSAIESIAPSINQWIDCITEGIEVSKVLGPLFGLFAVTPRIIAEGKIGFKKLETPIDAIAETVEVDTDMWHLLSASLIEGRLNNSPLVNIVMVEHSHDYTKETGGGGEGSGNKGWGQPIKLYWKDGWNQLGRTRSVKYQTRGMLVSGLTSSIGGAARTIEELSNFLNAQVRATHFGAYGRETNTIAVDCTWISKQLHCGDIVKVTHELAPDTVEGVIGMTERLGVVVGKSSQTTGIDPERLDILIGADANGAGIAPCAHGDSWTVGTLTLEFSAADSPLYEQSGNNDLDRFAAAMKVVLIQRDDSTPLTYTGDIASVSPAGKSMVFDADPFSGAGLPAGGVYVVFADYDDSDSTQQDFAYMADNAATPTLGTTGDAAQEWLL